MDGSLPPSTACVNAQPPARRLLDAITEANDLFYRARVEDGDYPNMAAGRAIRQRWLSVDAAFAETVFDRYGWPRADISLRVNPDGNIRFHPHRRTPMLELSLFRDGFPSNDPVEIEEASPASLPFSETMAFHWLILTHEMGHALLHDAQAPLRFGMGAPSRAQVQLNAMITATAPGCWRLPALRLFQEIFADTFAVSATLWLARSSGGAVEPARVTEVVAGNFLRWRQRTVVQSEATAPRGAQIHGFGFKDEHETADAVAGCLAACSQRPCPRLGHVHRLATRAWLERLNPATRTWLRGNPPLGPRRALEVMAMFQVMGEEADYVGCPRAAETFLRSTLTPPGRRGHGFTA